MTKFQLAQYIGQKALVDYRSPTGEQKQDVAVMTDFYVGSFMGRRAMLVRFFTEGDQGLWIPPEYIDRMTRIHDR